MCEISVIVPFYNDAKSCIKLVDTYINSFDQLGISYEFIITDDCSNHKEANTLKETLNSKSGVFIYRINKNFGQYGSLAFGISKAKGKKLLITDQDILDLKTEDLGKLLEKSSEFDLQYIYQEESQRGIVRKVFSSLWHLFIVLNIRKRAKLENPLPFRLVSEETIKRIIENNYTITTLDIALLKYSNHYSFYKIDSNNPLEIKIKSEYSISMLVKIGVYSIISLIIDLKMLYLIFTMLLAISFWFSTHSLTLPIIIVSISILVYGIALLVSKEQSYDEQIKQIVECVEK